MRIAVTGSSGKLGRAATARLLADGHEVIGFDLGRDVGPRLHR
jgi:nucleoside-diphosphate-sugar epimerase